MLPVLLFVAACTRQPAAAPPAPIAAVVPPDSVAAGPPAAFVPGWTRRAGTDLQTDSGTVLIQLPFTSVHAAPADSGWLWVHCTACAPPVHGRAPASAVVLEAVATPAEAAGGPLGDFVLAVQAAAQRRDLGALYDVMDPDFTYTFTLDGSRQEALAAWRGERFQLLSRLPALLAAGVFPYPGQSADDAALWVAPRPFAASSGYRDLRTGFRRVDGRWRWMFLVRGG